MVLSVEPSWANIADKLCYGLLDGAMLLPPLALALRFGLSGSAGFRKDPRAGGAESQRQYGDPVRALDRSDRGR